MKTDIPQDTRDIHGWTESQAPVSPPRIEELYPGLLDSITDILFANGIKATTMDSIAAQLKISKRTLYELFGSKSNMVGMSLLKIQKRVTKQNIDVFENSPNVMVAIMKAFKNHRDIMKRINTNFIRDLDSLYADVRKKSNSRDLYFAQVVDLLNRGVIEGYFRPDFNYSVVLRMMTIQMESLKRTEELFPPGITLLEVYDTICDTFIRGIATEKGIQLLNSMQSTAKDDKH